MWRRFVLMASLVVAVGLVADLNGAPVSGDDLQKLMSMPNATISVGQPTSIRTGLPPASSWISESKYIDTLGYDDGEADDAWAFYSGGNGYGQFFDAHGSFELQGVMMYFWPSGGDTFAKFMIVDDDGVNNAPGTVLYESDTLPITLGAWNYFDLGTTLSFSDGRFYVFYIQVGDYPDYPYLGIDTDANTLYEVKWIYYGYSNEFSLDDNPGRAGAVWMIRAVGDLTPFDYDAAPVSILSPGGSLTVGDEVVPMAVVANWGVQNATFTVNFSIYKVTKELVYTDQTTVTLDGGVIDTLEFTSWTPSDGGNYYAVVYTELTGDQLPSNDTLVTLFYIAEIPTYVESFESGVIPPPSWSHYKTGSPESPGWITYPASVFYLSVSPFDGSYAAGHNDDYISPDSCDDWLVTPQLSLGSSPYITFYHATRWAPSWTQYRGVWISTGSPDPNDGDYVELMDLSDSASDNAWSMITLDLSDYANDTVYIAFRYVGNGSDEWVIDYIQGYDLTAIIPEYHDVSVSSLIAPQGLITAGEPLTPEVQVTSYSNVTDTFYTHMVIEDGAKSIVYHDSTLTILDSGAVQNVNFESWVPTEIGVYTAFAYTALDGDENPNNDTATAYAVIAEHIEDFEASDGGFVPDPDTGAWEWGEPTYGPDAAHSGVNVWATNLDGDYATNADWYLYTPTLNVTSDNPSFGFYHWYSFESNFDYGYFEYSTDGGTTWDTLESYTESSGDWVVAVFDATTLGLTSGDVVQFRWHLHSDYAVCYAGWYIDDVFWSGMEVFTLEHDVSVNSIESPSAGIFLVGDVIPIAAVVANNGSGAESFDVIARISEAKQVFCDTVHVADFASGAVDTVHFEDFVPSETGDYTLTVFTTLVGDEVPANDTMQVGFSVIEIIEDFEASDGGFLPDPDTGAWEWGEPTYGPDAAHSGVNVWATNLDGDYENSADWKLISPVFIATQDAPVFIFYHWYNMESGFDGGNVKISTDGGATWTLITPDGGYPEVASGGNTGIPYEECFSGQSDGWEVAVFHLTGITEGTPFQIMFHFGSDGSVSRAGWYIDDIGGIGYQLAGQHDVGVTRIDVPEDGGTYLAHSTITPQVWVKNFGDFPETDVPVAIEIVSVTKNSNQMRIASIAKDGELARTLHLNRAAESAKFDLDSRTVILHTKQTIEPGESLLVDLPPEVLGGPGDYIATAYTMLSNDANPSNDTAQSAFTVVSHDAAIVDVVAPSDGGIYDYNDVVTPSVQVANFGSLTDTINVCVSIDTLSYTECQAVELTPGDTVELNFPDITLNVPGYISLTAWTELATDIDPTNDTMSVSFFVQYFDVGVVSIDEPQPTSYDVGSSITPAATVQNFGNLDVTTSVVMEIYKMSKSHATTGVSSKAIDDEFGVMRMNAGKQGALVYADTVSVTLAIGESQTVLFDDFVADETGSYGAVCYTMLDGDDDLSNDTASMSFDVESHDVCVAEIIEPSLPVYDIGTVLTPTAAFGNCSSVEETFTVAAEILNGDDEVVYSHSMQLTLPAGGIDTVEFDPLTLGDPGNYTVVFTTELAGDMNPANDTMITSLVVPEYHEPDTYSVFEPDTTAPTMVWEFGEPNPTLGPPGGAYGGDNLWGTELDGYYPNNVDHRIFTNIMNVTGGEPSFSFWHWYDFASGDSGFVEIWTETKGWQRIMTFTGSIPDWEIVFVPLDAFGLQSGDLVKLSFHFYSDASDTALGWYIDNIEYNQLSTEVYNDVILQTLTWRVGSVTNPDTITQGNVVRLSVQVRNNAFGPTATFRAFLKVFNDAGELVYSSSKLVRNLGAGAVTTVYFSPDWIPIYTGNYRLEVTIRKVGDPNLANNTLTTQVYVAPMGGGAGNEAEIPDRFFMNIKRNPFRRATQIEFGLPKSADVEVKVYDARGRAVRTLASGTMNPGYHTVEWDGTDNSGRRLSAGIYFIKFASDGFSTVKKVIMLE